MTELRAYHINRSGREVSVYLSEGVRNSGDLLGLWAQSVPLRETLAAVLRGERGDISPERREFNRQRQAERRGFEFACFPVSRDKWRICELGKGGFIEFAISPRCICAFLASEIEEIMPRFLDLRAEADADFSARAEAGRKEFSRRFDKAAAKLGQEQQENKGEP